MKILIINGPNLNLLGTREPEVYGSQTLKDVLSGLRTDFPAIEILHFQSNHEGEIIDRIQQAMAEDLAGLVINGGAFTHYSYAIADALRMLKVPKVEVHISHIFNREVFRHTSVFAPACDGMICGLGVKGYNLAVQALAVLD
jgi:3-dehydroquinate dehydratase-2